MTPPFPTRRCSGMFGEFVESHQRRRGRRQERRVRRRGHVRDLLQQVHVLGVPGELEVADHGREWRAAKGAVLLLVDLLEQLRLVEVGSVLEVLDQLLRSEEHTSELQSLMRISYAVFCLKNKNDTTS